MASFISSAQWPRTLERMESQPICSRCHVRPSEPGAILLPFRITLLLVALLVAGAAFDPDYCHECAAGINFLGVFVMISFAVVVLTAVVSYW